MLGPFTTASRLTPIHQMSLAVLSHAACASMSTTTPTTTRDRGDRYGPTEWAQKYEISRCNKLNSYIKPQQNANQVLLCGKDACCHSVSASASEYRSSVVAHSKQKRRSSVNTKLAMVISIYIKL